MFGDPIFGPPSVFVDNAGNAARFSYHGGRRYFTCNRGDPVKKTDVVSCDLHVWHMPTGAEMLVFVVIMCPECRLPIAVPAPEFGTSVTSGLLTMQRVVQCPGHWPEVDAFGNATGKHRRCGWAGVVREGRAHNPKCPASSPRVTNPTASDCVCGAILTDDEARALGRG